MATVALTPDTAMAVWATVTAVSATATVVLTPDTATAVSATAMAVSATAMAAMARGLPTLRPMLTMATVALTPDTAMAVMADTDLDTPLVTVMVDMATSDKSAKGWCRE